VELRHLRYFIRAAELLHFTRAAESLYISQPSLSVHIQQLEEELKTKLFARVGRNVRLTEAGEVLLVRAKHAVDELEAAGQEIQAMTGLLRGNLTLATISLFGSKVLPPWIDAFSLLHPNVHIKVRAQRAEDIESGLLAGTVDLGFSLTPAEHPDINVKVIMSDQIGLVVAKGHPLAKKEKLEVADLMTVSLALPSHKISSSRPMGTYFENIGIAPNVLIEQDDGHALLELVKLGGFATMLPKFTVGDRPNLCVLDLPPPGIVLNIGLMWTQLNAASSAFFEIATKTAIS
jgi:LysR family cyn operon transcriptional activator